MTTKTMQSLRAKGWTYQEIAVVAGITFTGVWYRLNPGRTKNPKWKAYTQRPEVKAKARARSKAFYHNVIKLALAEYRQRHGK